jgi:hypothetical protein
MAMRDRHPLWQTLDRLAKRLQEVDIPYAVMGGMAVWAHGVEHTTTNVDVLLTGRGLDGWRARLVGVDLDQEPLRSRRFVDRRNGMPVVVRLTGHHPGWGGRGPLTFPDPAEAGEVIGPIRVLTLPHLIQLKLAASRFRDLAAVEALARVHRLDESFLNRLHPVVHGGFRRCLEEIRRQEEFETQEG